MPRVDLSNRRFIGTVNYDSGDANQETVFHYDQSGDMVFGRYEGGRIRLGQIVGRFLSDDRIEFTWQYLNVDGRLVAGTCISIPEVLGDGRIRLRESWKVTLGPDAGITGESVIEEPHKKD